MTFPRKNLIGWALFEELGSAQMNGIDIDLTKALDAEQGGSYIQVPGANGDGNMRFDYSAADSPAVATDGNFHLKGSAAFALSVLSIDGTNLTDGAFGLVVDNVIGSSNPDTEQNGAAFVAHGPGANAVLGLGGESDVAGGAGDGLRGIGGDVTSNTASNPSSFAGEGIRGIGGINNNPDLAARSGFGGLFIGGVSNDATRDGAAGVQATGGVATDATAGPGIEAFGGVCAGGTAIGGPGGLIIGGVGDTLGGHGIDSTGGASAAGTLGGDGIIGTGGLGNSAGGAGGRFKAGTRNTAINTTASLIVESTDLGDAASFSTESGGTLGRGLAILVREGGHEGLRITDSIAGAPPRPALFLQQSDLPTLSAGVGDIFVNQNTGRLAFWNGDAPIPAYEDSATTAETAAYRTMISSAATVSTAIPVDPHDRLPGTWTIQGSGSTSRVRLAWTTPMSTTQYIAHITGSFSLVGVVPYVWVIRASTAANIEFSAYDAASGAIIDLIATAWTASISIYPPSVGS